MPQNSRNFWNDSKFCTLNAVKIVKTQYHKVELKDGNVIFLSYQFLYRSNGIIIFFKEGYNYHELLIAAIPCESLSDL